MTTKKSSSKSVAHVNHHATSATNEEEVTMSTTNATVTPVVQVTPSNAQAAKQVTPMSTVFIAPPSPTVSLPVLPDDFEPAPPGTFRTVVPRKPELMTLPQAVIDLKNFADYAQVLGGSAPSHDEITECFDLARLWSQARSMSSRWDAYCLVQEGLAWQALRVLAGRLRPAYSLALVANPKLSTKYQGLTTLLSTQNTIAQKAASTRRANKDARAKGLPETHGKVGKSAKRKAANAALAAKTAAAPAATPTQAAGSSVVNAGSATSTPATEAAAGVKAVTAVTAPGATVANGATPS